ncbi:hypothetical protein AM500_08540 [Bacillus sp. FJAT-18017]|uniref:phosphotransferase n=1 Tax=Bacillus sp. FJAT-18017 TaxID=1705566 RepID=UPI0006ADB300|nr:phosphotransferase [Bacillus sp. FJAT-18017]ALC89815.1 hypothetical protein AM500_08540 [Bacillus sp. FJAT-18017]
MKAQIKRTNPGDEDFLNRLLSYLDQHISATILAIEPIRPKVLFLKTSAGNFILKGYSSYTRLKLMESFTRRLKESGFTETYSYMAFPGLDPLYWDGLFYGCMEFIPPHPNTFNYYWEADRLNGARLLTKFHRISQTLEKEFQSTVPSASLLDKWEERLDCFIANRKEIGRYLDETIVAELIEWANRALDGMNVQERFLQAEMPAVLHGDVAHHNFIRSKTGKVFLIDFDLISIGSPAVDFLQYANRILPYIRWSLKHLSKYTQIAPYLYNKGFLYGLVYPSDILREWNRVMRERNPPDAVRLKQVLDQTMYQYDARRKFVFDVKEKIKSG